MKSLRKRFHFTPPAGVPLADCLSSQALQVLLFVAASRGRNTTLREIAAHLGLNKKSSARADYILKRLLAHGLVARGPRGTWTLHCTCTIDVTESPWWKKRAALESVAAAATPAKTARK